MFIDLRDRKKPWCEREISISSLHMCSDWGWNPQPFGYGTMLQPIEPPGQGANVLFKWARLTPLRLRSDHIKLCKRRETSTQSWDSPSGRTWGHHKPQCQRVKVRAQRVRVRVMNEACLSWTNSISVSLDFLLINSANGPVGKWFLKYFISILRHKNQMTVITLKHYYLNN